MELKKFKDLYNNDIVNDVEKDYKGLNYLSWATAYKLAMEQDPNMTYEILEDADGMPFFSRGDIHIVKTRVKMFGEVKSMILPIMDNKHNSVTKPNSRQVNDNIMRCLAKNIAMFGIGLPLYVGEDLIQFRQKAEEEKANKEKAIKMIFSLIKEEDDDALTAQLEYYKRKDLGECTEEELKKIYKYFKDMKK